MPWRLRPAPSRSRSRSRTPKAKAKAKAAFRLDARRDAVGGVAGPAVNPSMGAHKAPSMAPYEPATPPTPSRRQRAGVRAESQGMGALDWIGLDWPDPIGATQTELSRHDLRVGWRESHAMRGWGTGGRQSKRLHAWRGPGQGRNAGYDNRWHYLPHAAETRSANRSHRLPGALPPVPSRRQAVAVAVAATTPATAKNKNGHPRGYPFQ